MFYDGQPVEQGAEFDNVEEDGHLRSRLIFEVGQLRETILPLSLTRVWCTCVLSVNPVQFSADVDNHYDKAKEFIYSSFSGYKTHEYDTLTNYSL